MTFTAVLPLNTGQVADLTAAMAPVIDAIEAGFTAVEAQLGSDTGWTDVTMLAGYTSMTAQGHPLQVMRRNGSVFLQGGASGDFPGAVATIPAGTGLGFRPGRAVWVGWVHNTGSAGMATVATNGTLTLETGYIAGAGGAGAYMFGGSWPV